MSAGKHTGDAKALPGFELNFRPKSYFWPLGLETHLLARIKGAERQSALKSLIEAGRLDEIPEFLAQSALDDEDRKALSSIWPRALSNCSLRRVLSCRDDLNQLRALDEHPCLRQSGRQCPLRDEPWSWDRLACPCQPDLAVTCRCAYIVEGATTMIQEVDGVAVVDVEIEPSEDCRSSLSFPRYFSPCCRIGRISHAAVGLVQRLPHRHCF